MSLCPYFCDCPCCRHGFKLCEVCNQCLVERLRELHQKEHLKSVRWARQQIWNSNDHTLRVV